MTLGRSLLCLSHLSILYSSPVDTVVILKPSWACNRLPTLRYASRDIVGLLSGSMDEILDNPVMEVITPAELSK
ncbi:hypothetical protein GGS21DRAFT_192396 [Xylaria nigripes]|nr:hypothetical protein GGS21DRAFT_192396 [Xylaria nigripes]